MKMKEDENVSDYCVRVKYSMNKMDTLDEEVKNKIVMKKL